MPAKAQMDTAEFQSRLLAATAQDTNARAFLLRIQSTLSKRGKGEAMRQVLNVLYRVSPDGEVTARDVARLLDQERASRRAAHVTSALSWDLNGDGVLQASEREQIMGGARATVEGLLANADKNGDGDLNFEELYAAAEAAVPADARDQYSPILLFDLDGDGTVVVSEVSTTFDLLVGTSLDVEPNRVVSEPPSTCHAPKPAETDQIVVLSGYEGSALSTVTLAGRDAVTQIARLVIEDGDQPLYLFVSAHSNVIWDVSGDTDRLATMVVQARNAPTGIAGGVIGVDKDKLHFVRDQGCMPAYAKIGGREGTRAIEQMTRHLGRVPDRMFSFYTLGMVDLPSGEGMAGQGEGNDIIVFNGRRYELTPEGLSPIDEADGQLPDAYPFGASLVYRSLQRFHPDGVRAIDPDTVVSPLIAEHYDVLPQDAGLLQLILDGRLRRERDGPFTIVAPIERFPAGLFGAHSVEFVLAEDVPMPAGSPGHSSVISHTGACLTRMCR